jgi:hypothetical protein
MDVLLYNLRLKLAFAVARDSYFQITKAGFYRFLTVSVTAILCFLVAIVVFTVAQFIFQFPFQAVFKD